MRRFTLLRDDDFCVMGIRIGLGGVGRQTATLEVTSMSRPTPDNASLMVYNLDTLG